MTASITQSSHDLDYSSDPIRWRILMVLLMAIFMSLMSVSVINVALASIQEGLSASQSDIQWVLSGYALTFGVVLVSAGRAGDLMGRGGFFILGVAPNGEENLKAQASQAFQPGSFGQSAQQLGGDIFVPSAYAREFMAMSASKERGKHEADDFAQQLLLGL